MTALIIDDEEQSHLVLKALLKKNQLNIQLLGDAYNVKQGFKFINQLQPDLVFLDVQMPDGTGFDLLNKFDQINFNVIFTTGHNHYAHKAIRFGALDYLLKPIVEEELVEAIHRAYNKSANKIAQTQIQILTESLRKLQLEQLPTRLAISTNTGIIYKQIKDIIRLEAKQNYTEFTFNDEDKKILVSLNIGEYEEQFSSYQAFMRVHRSHLVNLKFVEQFIKTDGGYLKMKNNHIVYVSKRYKEQIIERLLKI